MHLSRFLTILTLSLNSSIAFNDVIKLSRLKIKTLSNVSSDNIYNCFVKKVHFM